MSTSSQKSLIGKIIVSKIFEMPLKKYLKYIKEVKGIPIYRTLLVKKIIGCSKLTSPPQISYEKTKKVTENCVAMIKYISNHPHINFLNEELNTMYQINDNIEEQLRKGFIDINLCNNIDATIKIIKKLRLINLRNTSCLLLLKGLAHFQTPMLTSKNNIAGLRPLTMKELERWLTLHNHDDFNFDNSRISRLTSNLSIAIDDGQEIPLRHLFANSRLIIKQNLFKILQDEKADMESGLPYTDKQIAEKLSHLNVSIRTVAHCRQAWGIPNQYKRERHTYRFYLCYFSQFYPLNRGGIKKSVPTSSGIYELSLQKETIKYPHSHSKVFYIGRSNNIRTRLREHLRPNTKNKSIKNILQKKQCYVRFKLTANDIKSKERKIFDTFVSTFGTSPKCNKITPS